MYGAPIEDVSIDNYRYLSFAKSTRLKTSVKLSSLPPTLAAAQQHLYRVYYQVQTWLGNELNPEQWGWIIKNNFLEPVLTLLPPAPDVLLNTIFCNCTKGCGSNCGCRKVGLSCSVVCGHCRGQSCLNATPDDESTEMSHNIEVEEAEFDEMNPIDYITYNISEESGKAGDEIEDEEDLEEEVAEIEDEDEEESE